MEKSPPRHLAGGSWVAVVHDGPVVGLFQESGGHLPIGKGCKPVGVGDVGGEVSQGLSW